jgi:hypothetical protein
MAANKFGRPCACNDGRQDSEAAKHSNGSSKKSLVLGAVAAAEQ